MNKFQKVALQIAKDDLNKKNIMMEHLTIKSVYKNCYHMFKDNPRWTYEKCLDFKNWNKQQPI